VQVYAFILKYPEAQVLQIDSAAVGPVQVIATPQFETAVQATQFPPEAINPATQVGQLASVEVVQVRGTAQFGLDPVQDVQVYAFVE